MPIDAVRLSVHVPEITFHMQQAIRSYQGRIDEIVNEEVEKVFKTFDFKALVQHSLDSELRTAIDRTIRQAVSNLTWDEEFRKAVQKEMKASMRRQGRR